MFLLLTYRPTENELFEERRAATKTKKEASDDYFSGAPFAIAEDGYSPPAASTPMTSRRQHSMAMYFIHINLTTIDFCIYSCLAYTFVAPFLDLRDSGHIIQRKVRNTFLEKLVGGND